MRLAPSIASLCFFACGAEPSEPAPIIEVVQSGPQTCAATATTWSAVHLDGPAARSHRFTGGGIAVFDTNLDGHLDLLVASAEGPRLWRGPDWTPTPVPAISGSLTGVSAADADGDGDGDVLWSVFDGPDVFWQNNGGTFEALDVGVSGGASHSQSSSWADLNDDGWLDLIVAGHGAVDVADGQIAIDHPADPTRIHFGGPQLSFTEASHQLPERFQDAYTFVASPIDLDQDGRLDLFAANDHPAWSLQQSAYNRDGTFELDDGSTGLQPRGAGMGIGVGDTNNDGRPDLLLPVWDRLLFLESHTSGWVEANQARGLRLPPHEQAWVGWGAELADLDNDGHLDAIVAFGHLDALAPNTLGGASSANAEAQPILTWLGGSDGFVLTDLGWTDDGVQRGFVVADMNADGVLDLAAPDLAGGVDLRLSTCSNQHWLTVTLSQSGGNRNAIGARVVATSAGVRVQGTVRAGGSSVLSSGPSSIHLGLGQADQVDLDVHWPDGSLDTIEDLPTSQAVLVIRH